MRSSLRANKGQHLVASHIPPRARLGPRTSTREPTDEFAQTRTLLSHSGVHAPFNLAHVTRAPRPPRRLSLFQQRTRPRGRDEDQDKGQAWHPLKKTLVAINPKASPVEVKAVPVIEKKNKKRKGPKAADKRR